MSGSDSVVGLPVTPSPIEDDEAARLNYAIEDLVTDLEHDALRDAFGWGPDVGREVVE